MPGLTKEKLAAAAAELLDEGGQDAVTLRAVAERVGVSHNAPYKHFRDRSALLAGVARRDFEHLSRVFLAALQDTSTATAALRSALGSFTEYALKHRSRYRLLFSDPALPNDEDLKAAAIDPFRTFVEIVSRCQGETTLPPGDPVRIGGLIFAAAHGAIDLEIGGRASGEKGLGSVSATLDLLLELLEFRA